MNSKLKIKNVKWGKRVRAVLVFNFAFLILNLTGLADETNKTHATNGVAATNAASAKPTPEPTPTTTREFFNAGTRRLGEGKLREAEGFFQTALTRQDEHFQPQTLHNLGHVRYEQGAEELKKSPDANAASQRAAMPCCAAVRMRWLAMISANSSRLT